MGNCFAVPRIAYPKPKPFSSYVPPSVPTPPDNPYRWSRITEVSVETDTEIAGTEMEPLSI